jgi:hypothetical protein
MKDDKLFYIQFSTVGGPWEDCPGLVYPTRHLARNALRKLGAAKSVMTRFFRIVWRQTFSSLSRDLILKDSVAEKGDWFTIQFKDPGKRWTEYPWHAYFCMLTAREDLFNLRRGAGAPGRIFRLVKHIHIQVVKKGI